jgi:hypothetical protein
MDVSLVRDWVQAGAGFVQTETKHYDVLKWIILMDLTIWL